MSLLELLIAAKNTTKRKTQAKANTQKKSKVQNTTKYKTQNIKYIKTPILLLSHGFIWSYIWPILVSMQRAGKIKRGNERGIEKYASVYKLSCFVENRIDSEIMAITLYFDHKSAVSIGVQSYIQGGQQIAFITSRGTTP